MTVLPGETQNMKRFAKHCNDVARDADGSLSLGLDFLKLISQIATQHNELRPRDVACFALLVEAVQKHRSIILLCEIGQAQNADIVSRSLFESALAVRYILKRPRPANRCSTELKKARSKLRYKKKGLSAIDFRAATYLAHQPLRFQFIIDELSKNSQTRLLASEIKATANSDAADWRRIIGRKWADIVKKPGGYSGLSVKLLSESCGFTVYYETVYRMQSTTAHGANPMERLHIDEHNCAISPKWETPPEEVSKILHTGTMLLTLVLSDLNTGFRLGREDEIRPLVTRVKLQE